MIREYWRDVRANWQAGEASLRRGVFYIGALAMTFVLAAAGSLTEVTFFGLKFGDFDPLLLGIPVIIGYLSFSNFSTIAVVFRLQEVHDQLTKHYWPVAYDNDFELFVRPVGGVGDTMTLFNDPKMLWDISGSLIRIAGMTRLTVLLGAPVVFEAFSVGQLWWSGVGNAITRSIVSVLCAIFTCLSVPFLVYISKKRESDCDA